MCFERLQESRKKKSGEMLEHRAKLHFDAAWARVMEGYEVEPQDGEAWRPVMD